MRRQTSGAADGPRDEPWRLGRGLRLDPFELPARVAFGATRAGDMRQIAVVARESVMIRRMTGAGVPLYLTVPMRSYRGVLLSVTEDRDTSLVALRLLHANGDLAVPLFEATDTDDVIADWQAWGRALGRPLLIQDTNGEICEPYQRLGGVIVKNPAARRANRFFADRRPRFLCERGLGTTAPGLVHREREIIARDVAD